MLSAVMRAHAQRLFEEALQKTLATYTPTEEGILACTVINADGVQEVIARYKVFADGTVARLSGADDGVTDAGL